MSKRRTPGTFVPGRSHGATLSPGAAKEGYWLMIGKASICVKAGDEGISITVYRRGKENEGNLIDTWVTHSELEE